MRERIAPAAIQHALDDLHQGSTHHPLDFDAILAGRVRRTRLAGLQFPVEVPDEEADGAPTQAGEELPAQPAGAPGDADLDVGSLFVRR